MSFSFGTRDYRNKQVIISDQVFSGTDTTETIISNGNQTEFVLSGIVGSLKEVYVNGVSQSIGSSGDKNKGVYADFYYTIGQNNIESSISQPSGAIITVVYTSLVKGRQVVTNDNEIERLTTQMGRNGTIARYETRNDTSSSTSLARIADTYIKFKGKPEITLTIDTYNNDILSIGQQVYFNAPIDELKGMYMVKSKDIQITKTGSSGEVFYTYVLNNNYTSENAINFFDNQRRKRKGNIGDDEYITRNIDVNNEMNIIFDNLSINELTITNDNDLNAELNAPLIE